MINWWSLGAHVLWINGAAALLAGLSYYRFARKRLGNDRAAGSAPPAVRTAFIGGALLVSVGAMLTSHSAVQRWGWSLLALGLIVYLALPLFGARARDRGGRSASRGRGKGDGAELS